VAYQDRVFSFHVVVKKYFQHQRDCSRKLPLVLLLIELCFTWSTAEKQQEKMCGGVFFFLFISILKFHF